MLLLCRMSNFCDVSEVAKGQKKGDKKSRIALDQPRVPFYACVCVCACVCLRISYREYDEFSFHLAFFFKHQHELFIVSNYSRVY